MLEKYTNERAYASHFYRWKHADAAPQPRPQEVRNNWAQEWASSLTSHLHTYQIWGLKEFIFKKKVRRSNLKGHNERVSTIVW